MSQAKVNDRLNDLLDIVAPRTTDFKRPRVSFYSHKKSAGQANYKAWEVSFNAVHLQENLESMLYETVAHELAHLVVYHQWYTEGRNNLQRRPKPHGAEWQHVMRSWFNVDPQRTHNYSMANVNSRKQHRWAATCGCHGRTHKISSTRYYKMILKGNSYICNSCHTSLELT